MKVNFKISRLGNKFHFIQTLAAWHHSTRIWDRENWIKKTGKLSMEEKKALARFAKILKKHSFDSEPSLTRGSFLGKPFFFSSKNEIWKELGNWATKKEVKEIQKIFSLFDKRFQKIWQVEKKKLSIKQAFLNTKFGTYIYFELLQRKLKIFYKTDSIPKEINIFLLISSSSDKLGGGPNLGWNVTLECSASQPLTYGRFAGVIWHEIAHIFQQKYFKKLIDRNKHRIRRPAKWPKLSYTAESILREAATYCLFSCFGYLENNYINNREKKFEQIAHKKFTKSALNDFHMWPLFAAYNLYNATGNYIKSNRSIDQEFLNKILDTWNKYRNLIN